MNAPEVISLGLREHGGSFRLRHCSSGPIVEIAPAACLIPGVSPEYILDEAARVHASGKQLCRGVDRELGDMKWTLCRAHHDALRSLLARHTGIGRRRETP